jgi:tRNA(fMet)-specific endonuclease VapC
LGELYYGAFKSNAIDKNIARVDEFSQRNAILSCDSQTAIHYGRIKNQLRAKGRPIPES